jgi:hypothetical protein
MDCATGEVVAMVPLPSGVRFAGAPGGVNALPFFVIEQVGAPMSCALQVRFTVAGLAEVPLTRVLSAVIKTDGTVTVTVVWLCAEFPAAFEQ